jgi:hypothetical protein
MALSTSYAAIVSRGTAQASVPSTLEDVGAKPHHDEAVKKEAYKLGMVVPRPDSEVELKGESDQQQQQQEVPSHLALRRPRPENSNNNNNHKARKPHQLKFHSYQPEFDARVVPGGGGGHHHRPKDPHSHGGSRSRRLPPLRTLLREMGCTEGPERDQARSHALQYVEDRLREWVRQLAVAQKHADGGGRRPLAIRSRMHRLQQRGTPRPNTKRKRMSCW